MLPLIDSKKAIISSSSVDQLQDVLKAVPKPNDLTFPVLRYNSHAFERLDGQVLATSLTNMDFSVRTLNVLTKGCGLKTLGDFLKLVSVGAVAGKWRNFGKKSFQELVDFILALDACILEYGAPDWVKFKSIRGGIEFVAESNSQIQSEMTVRFDFPIIRYTSTELSRLSEKSKNLPLDNLHLDCRAACAMGDVGIRTIDDLVIKISEGLNANELKNFGRKAFDDVVSAIRALSACIDESGACDWVKFSQSRGYAVIPEEFHPHGIGSVEQLVECLRKAMSAQYQDLKDGERYLDVLESRVIAKVDEVLTLEALGKKYDLHRERIRQMETEMLSYLHASLLNGCYSVSKSKNQKGVQEVRFDALRYRFRPELEHLFKRAVEVLTSQNLPVWSLVNWSVLLAEFSGLSAEGIIENANLLTVILGWRLVPVKFLEGVDGGYLVVRDELETEQLVRLKASLDDVHLYLQDRSEADTAENIVDSIEFPEVFDELGIDSTILLGLCSTIQKTGEGLWKIKPSYFKPKIGKLSCDIVEGIMRAKGSRMHSSDIVRKFRKTHCHLLESEDRVLMARMFNDSRFEPIGRTGYWVLTEWGLVTGTIREVLSNVLSAAPGSMHINEIITEVRKMVPCSASSVRHYLLESPEKFTRLSPNFFCIAGREPGDTI